MELLSMFLEQRGKCADADVKQRLTGTIDKLRDCGIKMDSSTHSPYKLVESNFPLLLSTGQRQALGMAAYLLSGMGFSDQGSQIQGIGKLTESDIPELLRVDVGSASTTHWLSWDFLTLKTRHRTRGELSNYQPCGKDEKVIYRDPQGKYCDIEATIDCWF
ncbi:Uncharacterized protein apha_00764 [Umezakia ovalisporum]|nr:Uncharacterized protein apha_00764 [Umezakia ovalisporum]